SFRDVKLRYFEIWPNLMIEYESAETKTSIGCYTIDENTKITYIESKNVISFRLPNMKSLELWNDNKYTTLNFYYALKSQKESSDTVSKWCIDYELFQDHSSTHDSLQRIRVAKYAEMP